MTIWNPEVLGDGPRYRAVADAIANDIANGTLRSGARLPTHRELATQIGVTVGTVSRAYDEVARLGLIRGEVGRGTFVCPSRKGIEDPGALASSVDLSRNVPRAEPTAAPLKAALLDLSREDDLGRLLDYAPAAGRAEHREAGAAWLGESGLESDPNQVVVTSGAQHAMLVALTAVAQPGDRILAGALTYPGMASLATQLRLRLDPVALDEEGLCPDALEAACQSQPAPRALYCMPSAQNPTAVRMSETRRRDIAAIAERYGIALIEDDIFGFLADPKRTPLVELAPENGYYVTSLSKSVAPGLRVGFLRAPARAAERVEASVRATMWMAPPLQAEIGARWITDGTAARITDQRRREARARARRVGRALGPRGVRAPTDAFHAWLLLPEPWRAEAFCRQALARGVGLLPAERFAVARTPAPHAVRICAMAARSSADLDRALEVLRELLAGGPEASGVV